MLNIVEAQDAVLAKLRSDAPQEVYEQGIADADTVRKVNGKVVPYIALQFGALTPRQRGQTFVGVRTFDHDFSIQVQVVAADPEIARKIMFDTVYNSLVGFDAPWLTELRPDRIGGVFPVVTSTGATEAYQYASGFRATLQLNDT